METQLLRDKATPPGDDVLKNPLYLSLVEGWQPEWRYYNDGRAWLCKVGDGRKTIFWFSVWEGWFQANFYFLERHLEALAALDMRHGRLEKEWGKMLPFTFRVPYTANGAGVADDAATSAAETIAEIRRVAEFKKKAK